VNSRGPENVKCGICLDQNTPHQYVRKNLHDLYTGFSERFNMDSKTTVKTSDLIDMS